MYQLKRLHGERFTRVNAMIDSLGGHITMFVNLIGSATLPFPEVCDIEALPGTACRAEGHLSARVFPATAPIDEAELIVEERMRALFGLGDEYAISGQPHSATQANQAVFRAVLGAGGGRIAGLSPKDGGHISHTLGMPGLDEFVPFPLGPVGIDYEALEAIVVEHRPQIVVAGGTSYTRAIDYQRLRRITDLIDGHLHADLAHTAPFVAVGDHPPAFPFVDSATFDTSKSLRGPRGGILVHRDVDSRSMQRSIFPLIQTSPNQAGMMAKAACLASWTTGELTTLTARMSRSAGLLSARLERELGPQVYGGTDTHLILFDVTPLGIDGKEAEERLEAARILANRNQVPGDPRSPWSPSGLRLGTVVPAILGYADEDVTALGDAVVAAVTRRKGHDEIIDHLLATYHRDLVSTANAPTS